MTKALLIGGPPTIRSHLLEALELLRPEASCTVVSGIRVGRELSARASPPFDLVILDLSLGDADAAVLLVDLHSASSTRPIVVLPAVDRRSDVLGALQLGAAGVLPRSATLDDAVAALRTALTGEVYIPARLVRASSGLAGEPVRTGEPLRAVSVAVEPPPPADLARLGLTSRQTEVLTCLLRGQSNKSIARELHLSVETIKDHVAAVLRGLSVHSRTQAVVAVERLLREAERPHGATLQSAWRAVAPARSPADPGASVGR